MVAIADQIIEDTSLSDTVLGDFPQAKRTLEQAQKYSSKGAQGKNRDILKPMADVMSAVEIQVRSDLNRFYNVKLNDHDYIYRIANPSDDIPKWRIVFDKPSAQTNGTNGRASVIESLWKKDLGAVLARHLASQRILNAINFRQPAHSALV